jgi:two-component system alkaline phosphatase synthesis response regulator PhoP
MRKILIADDEPNLVEILKFSLEKEGYAVVTAADGEAAVTAVRQDHPDLLVLDLMLPRLNGMEVCRIVRRESSLPIIILTAKTEEVDRVLGLEVGADDYVTKPFSIRELVARIRAQLRRAGESPISISEVLTAGDLRLDTAKREVTRAGTPVDLRPKEFDLLHVLMRNRGRVLTRSQLLETVWGYAAYGETRTVDVHVGRVRDHIEEDPAHPACIITVRGVGYRFV